MKSILTKNENELSTFYVEDIEIKTNILYLFKDVFLYFTPFFKVGTTKFFTRESISVILTEKDKFDCIKTSTLCGEQINLIYGGKKNEQHYFFESYKCDIKGHIGYFFPKLSVYMIKDDLGKKWIISDNQNNIFCFLRRFLRSKYLYPSYIERGYIPLHAACVAKENKAIAFLGMSGAGKTTAILPLIENFGYHLLAADLVFLTKEGIVIGTPEKMRISPISLRQYSPKYDYLIRSSEKLSFSPAFFSFAFQCNLVKEAKLDAIILPQISIDTKINDIKKITQIDLGEYISPFFFESMEHNHVKWEKAIYQLQYNGDIKKLVELYIENEVII